MTQSLIMRMSSGIQGKIIFAISIISWFIVMFWLFYPYTPIVIHNIKIVNQGDIYPGGYLDYQMNYSKEKAYPVVSVVKQLTNDAVIVLAPGPIGRLPVGKHKTRVTVKLPEYVCEGEHVFRIIVQYKVNPIRTISLTAISEPFNIKIRK